MLISLPARFPHLERVAEDKKKAMCHQQPGHGSEAFVLSVSAKLGLRRTMEAIEADIAEMERSSPGNKQGLESLRARQKECVETVLEQAKQVEQEWQDIERRLQIKVAIEDVSWTLLDDCKAIASVELSGIRLQKALFSNTSSVLHVSVDDVQVTRPGQTAEVLRKMAQPAATAYGTAPLLRVLAKQAAPVGGVNVYELLEIHLQPVRTSRPLDQLVASSLEQEAHARWLGYVATGVRCDGSRIAGAGEAVHVLAGRV